MDIQVVIKNNRVEIDNGYQLLELDLNQAKLLKSKLEEELRNTRIDESLKKDWNFFGGL